MHISLCFCIDNGKNNTTSLTPNKVLTCFVLINTLINVVWWMLLCKEIFTWSKPMNHFIFKHICCTLIRLYGHLINYFKIVECEAFTLHHTMLVYYRLHMKILENNHLHPSDIITTQTNFPLCWKFYVFITLYCCMPWYSTSLTTFPANFKNMQPELCTRVKWVNLLMTLFPSNLPTCSM